MRPVTAPDPAPRPGAAGGRTGWWRLLHRGGPPHGREPAALPPSASGSPGGRPRRRGSAPPPSPSRPRTPSRPRRRGAGSGADSSGQPRARKGGRDARRRPAASRRGGGDQHRLHPARRLRRVNAGVGGASGRGDLRAVDPRPARRLVPAAGGQPRRPGRHRSPHPPRARPPVEDAGNLEAVTRAYAAKYGDSPYVGPLLTEEAADATLRLEP